MAAAGLVSVVKKSDQAGRPSGKKFYVVLFKWDDVKTFTRDEKGVKVQAMEMVSAKTPFAVYATSSTINIYATSEGEEDARGYIHNVEFEHPGTEVEYDETMNQIINANLGAIVIGCDGTDAKLAGTPCTPLHVVQDNSQDNKEGNKNSVKLASEYRGGPLARIPLEMIPKTDNEEVNTFLGLSAAAAASDLGGV